MIGQEKREWDFPGACYMFNIARAAHEYVHTTRDDIDENIDLKSLLYVLARYLVRQHISLYGGYMAEDRKNKMDWLNTIYLTYDSKNSWHKKIPRDPHFIIPKEDERCKRVLAQLTSSDAAVEPPKPSTPLLEQLTIKSLPSVQIPSEEPEKTKEKKSSKRSNKRYDYLTGEEAGIIMGMNRNKVAEYCKKGLLSRRYEDPHDKRGSYNRLEVIELASKLERKGENS